MAPNRKLTVSSFQSYISCMILLHGAIQKKLHGFHQAMWVDDLNQAQKCLDALAICGVRDPVATSFSKDLTDCFVQISRMPAGAPRSSTNQDGHMELDPPYLGQSNQHPSSHDYFLEYPEFADRNSIALSLKLVEMLCSPLGRGEDSKNMAKDIETSLTTRRPSFGDCSKMVMNNDLAFESRMPFG
jgi:hypothetical protein